MNALWNAPISDRFSSLCARVFFPAAAILESEKTLGTRLGNGRRYVAFRGHCKELYMKHEHNSGVENCITGKETTDEKRIICFFGEKQKMGKNRKKGNEDCFIL